MRSVWTRSRSPPSPPGWSRSSRRRTSGRPSSGWRAEQPGIPWDTLLFSAKEATYKAWYPLTGILLDHQSIEVDLTSAGAFTGVAAAYDASGRQVVHRVRGRWGLGPRVLVALGVVG